MLNPIARAAAGALLVACLALPALAHHEAGHGESAAAAPAEIRVGPLVLTDAFTRATRPGAPVAGGFLTITNTGAEADRLLGGSVAVARELQVHEMANVDGVMTMRGLPDGLPIPADATVVLEPGGYHLMLMDLSAPLVEGGVVDVTLTFERAGTVVVPLAILAPNAAGAGH